jgi:hypothetical protein
MKPKSHKIRSQSDPNIVYEVKFEDDEWVCDCHDFLYRKWIRRQYCKHIKFVIKLYYANS